MSDLLGVLRVRSLLANGELESFAESAALFASVGVLLGDNDESRQIVLNGFLSGVGECEGVSCMYIKGLFCCSNPDFFFFSDSHLLEATQLQLNPPRPATPIKEETVEEQQEEEATPPFAEPDVAVVTGIPVIPTSGSFHFMQASELEATPFEEGAEWVKHSDAAGHQPEQVPAQALNGHNDESLPEVSCHCLSKSFPLIDTF